MLPSRGSGERQPLGVGRLSGDAARAVGLLSQALTNVRSFDRGCASEVRPCCNERAHGVTSSPGIWKQRRLPVPSSVPVDHAPWCGGRVAPSPGTRAAIVAFAFGVMSRVRSGPAKLRLVGSSVHSPRPHSRVEEVRSHCTCLGAFSQDRTDCHMRRCTLPMWRSRYGRDCVRPAASSRPTTDRRFALQHPRIEPPPCACKRLPTLCTTCWRGRGRGRG